MFVNPFTMFLGAGLISAPIVIHLINRIRFKRVRWAAMEFLLKSQKRSRRKLIIEQMILLLLRVFLVLLIALLLARFLGFKALEGTEKQFTQHIIVIDDTASLGDISKGADDKTVETFEQTKLAVIEKITKETLKAPTPQHLQIVRLSELDDPKGNFGRLSDGTVKKITEYLKPIKPSATHVDLVKGLEKAQALFDEEKDAKKVLHVVGDFRTSDWSSAHETQLRTKFQTMKDAEIGLYLFDVAGPERSKTDDQKPPQYSENLAITDFRPSARIAVKDVPTDFLLSVTNFSTSEKQGVFVRIRVNGKEKRDASQNIRRIRPNETVTVRFPITLTETAPKDAKNVDANAARLGQMKRFNVVTANLEGETTGLTVDNSRYTVVDVRDRIPILLIDNNIPDHRKKNSESFFIWKIFNDTLKGYDVQIRAAVELEKINLQMYSSVMLCNVPKLEDRARKNLEDYVNGGGGLIFFMGPNINENDVKFYNEKLYKAGEGIFPVALEPKPKNADLPEQELNKMVAEIKSTLATQLLIRKSNLTHPALVGLSDEARLAKGAADDDFLKLTYAIAFPHYFVVNRLQLDRKKTDILMTLPYYGSAIKGAGTDDTTKDTKLLERTTNILKELPVLNERFEKYKPQLVAYQKEILDKVRNSNTKLPELADTIEYLISKDKGDPTLNQPNLQVMWQDPELLDLHQRLTALLDDMKYGDPIYVTKPFGKGRVLAWLGSAGTSWNPSDKPFFPFLLRDSVQAFLSSSGSELNLSLQTPYEFNFDPTQYGTKATKWFAAEKPTVGGDNRVTELEVAPDPRGEQILDTVADAGESKPKEIRLNFTEGTEPGVWLFEFLEQRPNANGTVDVVSDFRALAYNFDPTTESDLSRAATADLKRIALVDKIYTMSSQDLGKVLSQRKADFSESPWLYLVMLLILIAEQAMAVRLSFHNRPAAGAEATSTMAGRGVVVA